jgi:hypothetical protein
MTPDQPPPVTSRPRRSSRRLRALLAVNALALGLYLFVRVDRRIAVALGPVGEGVYDLFNQSARTSVSLSATARRFVKDVRALGGEPSVAVLEPGFLGLFGRSEWFNVSFHNRTFDDEALARLAAAHGDRIGGLYLQNTGVTDAGLRHLNQLTMLRHLEIRNYARRARRGVPAPPPTITDAGLIHLKGLTQLWSLNLSDLPITDAGLDAIKDLPALLGLYLSRTKIQGPGLARLKSLPLLSILYLDGSAMTEDGLRALSGATRLQTLSLNGVPLTDKALPLLAAIPRLDRLEITGCGFLDEEVAALVKSKPGLRVLRQ